MGDGCDYPWRHSNICNNKDLANPPQSTEHCDWLYGIFGHETSCTRYWACQGGYPRLQRCPAMLVFDKNRRRCVTPPTEDCDVPTTKAPPPGEENNFSSGSGSRGTSGSGGRAQQSPNPRRGGGQRRPQGGQSRPQPSQPLEAGDPLPFNLPPGAVPLNTNN